MKNLREIKYQHKYKDIKIDLEHKNISDRIIQKVVYEYLENNNYMDTLLELRDILPIYLISGMIYLRRYIRNMGNKVKDCFLSKIFFTCCWIGVKNLNDNYVTSNEFLDNYNYNNKEIICIEAHILNKINYNIEISKGEIDNWEYL